MKRFIALALLAMMVFGATAANAATTFQASGQYDFAWGWTDNLNGVEDDGEDDFSARQRFRFNASFLQGETLAGYANFEIGDVDWGRGAGALGTQDLDSDNNALELRHLYMDWYVPNTDLKFRVGKFGVDTQAAFYGSAVLDETVTGALASYKVNENASVLAFWARLQDDDAADTTADPQNDEVDAFGLLVPLQFDGVSATPFFIYAMAGEDTAFDFYGTVDNDNSAATDTFALDDDATAWWLGTSLKIDLFDPITFAMDFNYGAMEADEIEAAGFYTAAKLAYATDYATPAIIGWYASGNDEDDAADNEYGVMPALKANFGPTDMLFDAGNTRTNGKNRLNGVAQGTWGLGFVVENISFVEDLTHTFRVVYVQGTNDEGTVNAAGDNYTAGTYLTEEDSLVEVNFNHKYMVYDNLALLLDLGYVSTDIDDDVWGNDDFEDAYRVSVGLSYTF